MSTLYRQERQWLIERPRIEVCAAYKNNKLVLEKNGEQVRIVIEYNEAILLHHTVFTHWHPPNECLRLYGHEDGPLSWNDVVAGAFYEQVEIRALSAVALHRFIYPFKRREQWAWAERTLIDTLDPGRNFADSRDQEQFLHYAAKYLGCQYEKIKLDKLGKR